MRKERCKKRAAKIHEQQDMVENNNAKKRRIDEEGKYKVLKLLINMERAEEEKREPVSKKMKRDEQQKPVRFLGAVEKDMILEDEIDWEKRRKEILAEIRKQEEERETRIQKARMMEKSWELVRECRKFLQDNERTWQEHREEMRSKEEEAARQQQIGRAVEKQRKFREKQEVKDKKRRNNEMLE